MTNQEISRRFCVSSDTVKYHVENILGKLALARRSELRR
jgi:DNA-binding NarL/FixJ family response regulator